MYLNVEMNIASNYFDEGISVEPENDIGHFYLPVCMTLEASRIKWV